MKRSLGIWTVRPEAENLGRHLQSTLKGKLYLASAAKRKSATNKEKFRKAFSSHRQWLLIMASGIAVRYLQGLPNNKRTDPAVVVLDEGNRFAISLLAGHEGGANELAYNVANVTGAVPVITTATESLKPLVLGIGCRKNVAASRIDAAVKYALDMVSRSLEDVREVATIDLKSNEPGLVTWCEEKKLPIRIISRELIAARPWNTKPSAWVRRNIGVDGVCEPCALLASIRGKLLLPKTAWNGVTVAIAADFEYNG